MKQFPSIRLRGNQDLAATYIRRGKMELFRTQQVRDKMGVPVFGRSVRIDDFTTIDILLEKEQELVTIHSHIPEGEEAKAEEVKEEEERRHCIPAFIVYRNVHLHDDPVDPLEDRLEQPGYKIIYKDKRWLLDPVPDDEKFGGAAAWWHLKDRYDDYYDKRGLKYCAMVTWQGNNGGFFHSMETPLIGPAQDYYDSYVFFEGKRFAGTPDAGDKDYVVRGACLLPNRADDKDYFYILTSYDDGQDFDPIKKLYVYRIERDSNPDTDPVQGPLEQIVEIDQTDVSAAANGGGGAANFYTNWGLSSAYIDKDGFASLNIGVTVECVDDRAGPTGVVYMYSPEYIVRERDNLGNPPATVTVYHVINIELISGDWELESPFLENRPVFANEKIRYMENMPTTGGNRYGDPGQCGKINDIAEFLGGCGDTPIDQDTVTRWRIADQVSRAGFAGEETGHNSVYHTKATLFGFYGGCDARYDFGLQLKGGPVRGTSRITGNDVGMRNYDFDPAEPDPLSEKRVPRVPFYLYNDIHTRETKPITCDLVGYKNGLEISRFEVFSYKAITWSSRRWKTKVAPGFGLTSPAVGEWGKNLGHNRLWKIPTWFDQPVANDEAFGAGYFSNPAIRQETMVFRRIVFQHPMIPEVFTYIEVKLTRFSGTPIVVTRRVSYHVNGKERWSYYEDDDQGGNGAQAYVFSKISPWDHIAFGQNSGTAGWHDLVETASTFFGRFTYGNTGDIVTSLDDFAAQIATGWEPDYIVDGPGDAGTTVNCRLNHHVSNTRSEGSSFVYGRVFCAIHQKSFGPDSNEYPYILYIHHPTEDDIKFDLDPPYLVLPYFKVGRLDNVEFFSNCLTEEEIQEITGEEGLDQDYVVDFGVI